MSQKSMFNFSSFSTTISSFLDFPPPSREIQDDLLTDSQDRLASPSAKPSGRPGNETEERGAGTSRSREVRQLQREIEDLKVRVERRGNEIVRLRGEEEKLIRKCRRRDDRIMELEHEIGQMCGLYQEDVQRQTQHTREVEERLQRTEELLATRSAELSGAHAFLSTTDRLSEAEVLSIVRDLNENIYQVAVNLTEEWEKLESSQVISPMDVDSDPTSRPSVPALVQLAHNRDPTGLTFLFQSCLCSQVVSMTSGWGHHQELAILESVHQRLSASEGQAISARWRSLTYSNLSRPLPHSTSLVEQLANVLDETGSFSSTQQSLEFIKAVALEGVESILRVALHLERVFMVEVTSSDMLLLYESPGSVFDGAGMTNEFGSGDAPTSPGSQDRVAGTTEVGVGKTVCGGPEEGRLVKILLKTKVVLEKDVMTESGGDRGIATNEM